MLGHTNQYKVSLINVLLDDAIWETDDDMEPSIGSYGTQQLCFPLVFLHLAGMKEVSHPAHSSLLLQIFLPPTQSLEKSCSWFPSSHSLKAKCQRRKMWFLSQNFWSQYSLSRQIFPNFAEPWFKISLLIHILGCTTCEFFLTEEACEFKSHSSWAYWVMEMTEDFNTRWDFLLLIYPEK